MLEGMTEPLETGVPRLIDRLLHFMEKEQAALNLIDEVPELRESAQAMSLENLARDTSLTFLKVHLSGQDSSAINCKLFFVQTASMALVRRYVRDRPADMPARALRCGDLRHDRELSAGTVKQLPARCRRESPFGAPIAHGFLLMSLLARLLMDVGTVPPDASRVMNLGVKDARFRTAVRAGTRVRARISLARRRARRARAG